MFQFKQLSEKVQDREDREKIGGKLRVGQHKCGCTFILNQLRPKHACMFKLVWEEIEEKNVRKLDLLQEETAQPC